MHTLHNPLLSLPVCRIRIDFTSRQKWEVYGREPLFRGQAGRYIRQSCCPFYDDPGKQCGNCGLSKGCLYLKLFAPPARNHHVAPRPFVPVLGGEDSRHFLEKGEKGSAGLTLFGPAIRHRSLFCEAALSALSIFPLQTGPVRTEKPGGGFFPREEETVSRPLRDWVKKDLQPAACIKLRCISPLRLTGKERSPRDAVRFSVLMQALIRRLRDLKRAFDTDGDMGDSKEIFDKTGQVAVKENHLKWERRRRFSPRQGQDVYLNGFTGTISFSGEMQYFYPLLKAAEIVHIGKGTSSGCGRVMLNAEC
ncbi:MAG: CRISPR system precrRNA processing endoribonuclease RAMP protein Cas6 [Desulfococcaceae bacterium]|jgi:hypothetical protein|nr:CRISPR system precrRNA processing endoribonuclease RAMP protein Cas6 [Desulfococcaceae bacterium]